ncbi:MAG: acetyl-CoA C-acetyltransferase [Candidatus Marinimicrobia bacterium]|nr:acetyl-CoA C-acetyltransferase [Candidatus Neomarinimicrobiota bacterium]
MSSPREVIISLSKRTAVGSFQGDLSTVPAPKLGATVIESLISESNLNPETIDEVIMGNVLAAGLGQAPARQAALVGGLPNSVECLTVNKMCGSGLKAIMLASQAIQVGDANIIIAGGMENMSQAPYLLPKARSGYRLGHGQLLDSMIKDGLWDVTNDIHMGNCAELCAKDRNYSRETQDAFAKDSYEKALKAQKGGLFQDEIIPVSIPQRKGDPLTVDVDEEPGRANFDKMTKLRSAFEKDGTITAANASKINDGAAAVIVQSMESVDASIKPLFKIISQASAAHAPEWFTTAPSKAIRKVLEKAKLTASDIDLWEINEAFAPVTMAAIEDFNLESSKVNVHGGAIAIGHPIGASGARIMTTLLHAMERYQSQFGLATLCIGGGEASALVVERIS